MWEGTVKGHQNHSKKKREGCRERPDPFKHKLVGSFRCANSNAHSDWGIHTSCTAKVKVYLFPCCTPSHLYRYNRNLRSYSMCRSGCQVLNFWCSKTRERKMRIRIQICKETARVTAVYDWLLNLRSKIFFWPSEKGVEKKYVVHTDSTVPVVARVKSGVVLYSAEYSGRI